MRSNFECAGVLRNLTENALAWVPRGGVRHGSRGQQLQECDPRAGAKAWHARAGGQAGGVRGQPMAGRVASWPELSTPGEGGH